MSVPWDEALSLQYLSLIEIRLFFPNVLILEPSVSPFDYLRIGPRALPEVAEGWGPEVLSFVFSLLALCYPQGHSFPFPGAPPQSPLRS